MNIYLASLFTRPLNLAISFWMAQHFFLLLSRALALQLCLECLPIFPSIFAVHFYYLLLLGGGGGGGMEKESWAIFDGRVRTDRPWSFTAGICISRLATESKATIIKV